MLLYCSGRSYIIWVIIFTSSIITSNFRYQELSGPRSSGGGAPYSTGTPPSLTLPTSKYYQKNRLGGERPQAPGRLDQKSQGRPARHWADSKGLLSLMVAGSLNTKWIRRGSKGKGYHERVRKGGGGESGIFDRG